MVLVEGTSDLHAVSALARRVGRDLSHEGTTILAMGGATNVGRFMERFGPAGLDLQVAGLCDAGEVAHCERALRRAGLVDEELPCDLEALGFFVCNTDLEDELIRSVGTDRMQRFIEAQGELRSFRTFQQQPAQQGRSIDRQLHRFVGTRSGRKSRYGHALIDEVDLARIPPPLEGLLQSI